MHDFSFSLLREKGKIHDFILMNGQKFTVLRLYNLQHFELAEKCLTSIKSNKEFKIYLIRNSESKQKWIQCPQSFAEFVNFNGFKTMLTMWNGRVKKIGWEKLLNRLESVS